MCDECLLIFMAGRCVRIPLVSHPFAFLLYLLLFFSFGHVDHDDILLFADWSTDDTTPAAKDGQGETPVALIGGVVAIVCVFVLIYFLSQ